MTIDRKRVDTAVNKVIALRRLTAMTGTRTTRSQGELLQVLNAEELALAAELLLSTEGQTDANHNPNPRFAH
jgi:hypothetical protein